MSCIADSFSVKHSFKELLTRLIKRGYPWELVKTIPAEVLFESLKTALQNKPKTSEKILPFVTTFNHATPNLKKILMKHCALLQATTCSRKYILMPQLLLIGRKISKAPCKRTQHCWLTAPNIVGCYMLRPFAHPVGCCCAKFETSQTFQPTIPTFLLFRDRRSVAQQCWISLHSSSNIVGAAHAHYAWFTKTFKDLWVVSFPRCTAGPKIVGSCCIRLHTTANNVGSCCVRLHAA